MSGVYYNENDAYAAQWLRNLMTARLIPEGKVDERSIVDVRGSDLAGFEQCHFFAGIGGWALALQIAGWQGPCWTGSCPCQPFSAAGKKKGVEDVRHLWPELRRLIAECGPVVVFGEQVESKDGRKWLSGVRSDVEVLGYRLGSADLCAAGVKAPHRRQRLYWVAESKYAERWPECEIDPDALRRNGAGRSGEPVGLVQSVEPGLEGLAGDGDRRREPGWLAPGPDGPTTASGTVSEMEFSQVGEMGIPGQPRQPRSADGATGGSGPRDSLAGTVELAAVNGRIERGTEPGGRGVEPRCGLGDFWSDFDIVHCIDGKARRIEAGTFPLAHGVPARVGKLRAYGNAIVPQVAAAFVKAFIGDQR